MPIKSFVKPFIIPLLLLVIATIATLKWGDFTEIQNPSAKLRAFIVIFPIIPYLLFIVTILLGLRSNNSGIVLVSILIMFSYAGIMHFANSAPTLIQMIAFLLPINIFLWGSIRNLPPLSRKGLYFLIAMAIEILIVFYVCYFHDLPDVKFNFEMYREFPNFSQNLEALMKKVESFFLIKFIIPGFPSYAALITSSIIGVTSLYKKEDHFFAAYIVVSIVVFIGITSSNYLPSTSIYFTISGFILIIASIEASFSMAYIDELTSLPGRRSLNESMANLGKKYSIAMIDIDHFKKFNDTYGHKTGDQVLRMVALKLGEVSGGAKTYRYGGEEFTAIFPGKSAKEALPYMEEYREIIESSPFFVRDKKRKKTSSENRGKNSRKTEKSVSVTVSIGIASSGNSLNKPDKVIKAADKILYKAKNAGRNIVKT
jgi:diguanylate cyclase (GGDEF)-like protein